MVPQRLRRCSARATSNGTWQRFIIIATPQGPNNEGGPSSRARQRPDGRQPPARQPVPEHRRRRASRRSARPATSRTLRGARRRSATCPATQPATTEGDAMMAAPPPRRAGRSRRHRRADRARDHRSSLAYLGLHEGHPVHARRSELNAVFESANSIRVNSPVRIAGVDGRQGQGDRAAGGHRPRRSWSMEINKNGPADPRGRDRQDPAAHLPRGQLLRRPHARLAGRARARRRRHDQGHPHGRAGPARPGADRAPERHAPGPADLLDGLGDGAELEADGRRGRGRRPVHARRDRGAVLQRRLRRTRPTALRGASQVNEALLGTEPRATSRA